MRTPLFRARGPRDGLLLLRDRWGGVAPGSGPRLPRTRASQRQRASLRSFLYALTPDAGRAGLRNAGKRPNGDGQERTAQGRPRKTDKQASKQTRPHGRLVSILSPVTALRVVEDRCSILLSFSLGKTPPAQRHLASPPRALPVRTHLSPRCGSRPGHFGSTHTLVRLSTLACPSVRLDPDAWRT